MENSSNVISLFKWIENIGVGNDWTCLQRLAQRDWSLKMCTVEYGIGYQDLYVFAAHNRLNDVYRPHGG